MTGYVNPTVVLLPDPVGVDKAIQDVQGALFPALSWLHVAFGRAFLQQEKIKLKDSNREERINYPEARGINQEPINMMPNDNLRSYCFFLVRDPTSFVNYTILDTQTVLTTPVSLYFWINLYKVDNTKNHRFAEELKLDVLRVLQGVPNLVLTQIFEGFDRVFEQFTLTDTYRQYVMPKYAAFRFDFELSYMALPENC